MPSGRGLTTTGRQEQRDAEREGPEVMRARHDAHLRFSFTTPYASRPGTGFGMDIEGGNPFTIKVH